MIQRLKDNPQNDAELIQAIKNLIKKMNEVIEVVNEGKK